MYRKILVTVTVGFGLVCSQPIALGQQSPPAPTFLDRVENFGRNLFGGLNPREETEQRQHQHQHTRVQPITQPTAPQAVAVQADEAGNVQQRPVQMYRPQPVQQYRPAAVATEGARPSAYAPSTAQASTPRVTRTRPPVAAESGEAQISDSARPSAASSTPATQAPAQTHRTNETSAPAATAMRPNGDYGSLPLHQRMAMLRKSPFEESGSSSATTSKAARSPVTSSTQPSSASAPRYQPKPAAVSERLSSNPTVVTPRQESRSATGPTPATSPSPLRPSTSASVPAVSTPAVGASTPSVSAVRVPVASTSPGGASNVATPSASSSSSAGLINPPPALVPQAAAKPAAPVAAPQRNRGNVLVSRQSPNLAVETLGPRKIAVGKESAYEVLIANSGGVAAEEVTVQVDLPAWAEVRGSETSVGSVQMLNVPQGGRQLQWKMARLEASGRERLSLRLVPRESRPFDLGVKWDFRQSGSQAVIEVQEPKLAVSLEGPREVLFGKKEQYRLRVGNTGTGDAENVVLKLWPVGSQAPAASHNFGTIPPGQQKLLELELTARQVGNLNMKVELQCDSGARAELTEPVLVRRAALELAAEGPKFQYVATAGVYRVRLTNPGTALARSVTVTATVPDELKLAGGSDGAQVDPNGSIVRWKFDSLAPGAEKVFEIKCAMVRAGTANIALAATADDEVAAAATATTQVEAMADVAMEMHDPSGPVPVGEDALYEIRLRNRGSKAAENVEVAVFFSQGIEPATVEGGLHRISSGQVSFAPIPTLAPGKELVLKVFARAQTQGRHVCRAEMNCHSVGTRLACEESTFFYGQSLHSGPAASIATQQSQKQVSPASVATQDRATSDGLSSPASNAAQPAAVAPVANRPGSTQR